MIYYSYFRTLLVEAINNYYKKIIMMSHQKIINIYNITPKEKIIMGVSVINEA